LFLPKLVAFSLKPSVEIVILKMNVYILSLKRQHFGHFVENIYRILTLVPGASATAASSRTAPSPTPAASTSTSAGADPVKKPGADFFHFNRYHTHALSMLYLGI
jgi:hypothetical protein